MNKERVAHDLAIIYVKNQYGRKIKGQSNSNGGEIWTEILPSLDEIQYTYMSTGEKGIFGWEKTEKVEDGLKVDQYFDEMLDCYYYAFDYFYEHLNR